MSKSSHKHASRDEVLNRLEKELIHYFDHEFQKSRPPATAEIEREIEKMSRIADRMLFHASHAELALKNLVDTHRQWLNQTRGEQQ